MEIVFGCILFEELLHKGTFKVVHHGVVNQPSQGLLGTPAAVKRLKGKSALAGGSTRAAGRKCCLSSCFTQRRNLSWVMKN